MGTDAAEIKRDLQARIREVCETLLPGGKAKGHEYHAASLAGGKGSSLRVHLAGSKAGWWAEFNGSEAKGDVFALVEAVRGCSFVEALSWARDFLGIADPAFFRHAAAPKREYRRAERPRDAHRPREGATLEYLTGARRLTREAIDAYQIGEAAYPAWAAQETLRGTPAIVFPSKRAGELVMVKWLAVARDEAGKKAITKTKDAEPCLFGWQAIPDAARTVVIAEGEIDALTWWQMGWPALAPPRGTGSLDWVDAEYPNLERFEAVYLAFDNDEPGRKCAAALAPRFGDRTRLVGHLDPARYGKDANEWLVAGATPDDFARLIREARDNRPAELRSPLEYSRQVVEVFYPTAETPVGFEPPFGRIAGRVRFRPGELSLWTGYNHHGKTDVVNYMAVNACYQGERVCIASLEVQPAKTLARLVRQATGERRPTEARITEALGWLADRLWLFDSETGDQIDRVLEVFTYALRRYGCTQFVIDNLTRLGVGEEDWDAQKAVGIKTVQFAVSRGAHLHLVAHPRKAHDESKPPGKQDVRGHGSLTDLAHNVFVQWRNVAKGEELARLEAKGDPAGEIPSLVESKEDAVWIVAKQRETGDTPMIRLWFNRESLQFHEQPWQRPFCFIDTPAVVLQAEAAREADGAPDFVQWEDDGERPF